MMDSDGNLIDVSAGSIREQFDTSMLLLRHDVLRLCGDDEQADRLLRDNSDLEPFADTRAIQLIAGKRWRELYDFASRILNDDPYQQIALIPRIWCRTTGIPSLIWRSTSSHTGSEPATAHGVRCS